MIKWLKCLLQKKRPVQGMQDAICILLHEITHEAGPGARIELHLSDDAYYAMVSRLMRKNTNQLGLNSCVDFSFESFAFMGVKIKRINQMVRSLL